MGEQLFQVDLQNDEGTKEWIIARVCQNELWYYANYDSKEQAMEIAKLVDGIVVRRVPINEE